VPVGTTYRPALPISDRPELAAAFARGEEARASGHRTDEAHIAWIAGLPSHERTAYWLGLCGPEALQAPAPIAVVAGPLVAQLLADTWLRGSSRRRREKVAVTVAFWAFTLGHEHLGERARQRRAHRLGVTVETAPRLGSMTVGLGGLLGRVVLMWIQQF